MVGQSIISRSALAAAYLARAFARSDACTRPLSCSRAISSIQEKHERSCGSEDGSHPSWVRRGWTAEELDTLTHLVQDSATNRVMAKKLERSTQSVNAMRHNLARHSLESIKARIEGRANARELRPWSPEEDSQLRARVAKGHSLASMAFQLRRSRNAVAHRKAKTRAHFPVISGVWSHEEVQHLESHVANGLSIATIASKLRRTHKGVYDKLHSLRNPLRHFSGSDRYTAEEIAELILMRQNGLDWSEISEKFPQRTDAGLRQHYYRHVNAAHDSAGLQQHSRRWTSHEISILCDWSARKIPAKDVAKELGRTLQSVEARKKLEEASNRTPHRKWSREDVETLWQMKASGRQWKEIAPLLGRTVAACHDAFRRFPPGSKTAALLRAMHGPQESAKDPLNQQSFTSSASEPNP